MDSFSQRANSSTTTIVLDRSPSIVCRVGLLDDGKAALAFPLGVIARTRILARLLLQYLGQKPNVRIATSNLDDRPESESLVAPMLIPLFGQIPGPRNWGSSCANCATIAVATLAI
jgi:hypothetical protein